MTSDELAQLVQKNLLMPHAKLGEVLIPSGVDHEHLQLVIAFQHFLIAVSWLKSRLGAEDTASFLEANAMELRGQVPPSPPPGQGNTSPNVTPMRKEPGTKL